MPRGVKAPERFVIVWGDGESTLCDSEDDVIQKLATETDRIQRGIYKLGKENEYEFKVALSKKLRPGRKPKGASNGN